MFKSPNSSSNHRVLTALTILGFIVGAITLAIGYSHEGNLEYRVIGFVCIALSFGLFKKWNWVRIMFILLSLSFICFYLKGAVEIFIFRPEGWQWGAMALTAFSPVFLLSLSSVIYLTRPKIKEQFKTP